MLLSEEDIAHRIGMYTTLKKAYASRDVLINELPLECPRTLRVYWSTDCPQSSGELAVEKAIRARWALLRQFILTSVDAEVAGMEENIKKFEGVKDE